MMRSAEIRFHNSNTKAEVLRFTKEWYEARELVHPLYQNTMNAALKEFQSDSQSREVLGLILFKALKRNADRDLLDGMTPIAKALLDAGYPDPEILRIYTQCLLSESEFELAKEVILSTSPSPEQAALAIKQLDTFKKNWEGELEARKRDQAGEPLPQAKIYTTKGEFVVELFENEAPEAVASFISLAEKGFYDYLDFFLVIDHFAAQVGSPTEDGIGGPGYMLKDEFGLPNSRNAFRGSLVLATLEGKTNSGGSQFFIPLVQPMHMLDRTVTVFGRVVSGMHNVANLNRVDPSKKKDENKKDEEPTLPADEIIRIEILRKRNHPYEPNRLPNVDFSTTSQPKSN
jgi:cyclophilin family peptidyl-prolyl cis-trans isomerase